MSATANEMTVEQRLIRRWRKEANSYMRQIRKVQYHDQAHRAQLFVIAQTLRQCANALANALYREKVWKESQTK